jgi:hypothetical protein
LTLPVGGAGTPAAGMVLALCRKVDFLAWCFLVGWTPYFVVCRPFLCAILYCELCAKKSTFWNKMEKQGISADKGGVQAAMKSEAVVKGTRRRRRRDEPSMARILRK